MIFDVRPVEEAIGCYLAHSHKVDQGRIGKGTLLDAKLAARLLENGTRQVQVAQPGPNDVHEDTAATRIASALSGAGVAKSKARTGRVNLHAVAGGLCEFNREALIAANAVNEGITVSTLDENRWVASGRMVCTIKIIPYAVDDKLINKVVKILENSPVCIHEPKAHSAALIQTRLSSLNEKVLDKTRMVTLNRLNSRGISLQSESRCEHSVTPLCELIKKAVADGADWLLVVGASAISDRRDIIPVAIETAGGTVDRYGIPVDPGNLLLIGHIGKLKIIGLPGCARSARYNGLDLILDRMACQLTISNDWLSRLAIGGLLTEIADRPTPRVIASEPETVDISVGAVLLAAGSSQRAGKTNKLLFRYQGEALVLKVAQMLKQSRVSKVVAVTGFERAQVEEALRVSDVHCQHNIAHASGMASSVVSGVSGLLETDAILVCLGDMPHITPQTINQIIDKFKTTPDKSIFIPVHNGQRGNPVLFSRVFFDTLLSLEGDTGARLLCRQYPDQVCEVHVTHPGVLLDYDTQSELQSLENT